MLWANRDNNPVVTSGSLITKKCKRVFGRVGSVGGVASSGANNSSQNSITDQRRVVRRNAKCGNKRLHDIVAGTLGNLTLDNKLTNCLDCLPRR